MIAHIVPLDEGGGRGKGKKKSENGEETASDLHGEIRGIMVGMGLTSGGDARHDWEIKNLIIQRWS